MTDEAMNGQAPFEQYACAVGKTDTSISGTLKSAAYAMMVWARSEDEARGIAFKWSQNDAESAGYTTNTIAVVKNQLGPAPDALTQGTPS